MNKICQIIDLLICGGIVNYVKICFAGGIKWLRAPVFYGKVAIQQHRCPVSTNGLNIFKEIINSDFIPILYKELIFGLFNNVDNNPGWSRWICGPDPGLGVCVPREHSE